MYRGGIKSEWITKSSKHDNTPIPPPQQYPTPFFFPLR